MNLTALLDQVFPIGHHVSVNANTVVGEGNSVLGKIALIGTINAAEIDHHIALTLSRAVLDVVKITPGRPILFLVDTVGQVLSRNAELLCMNRSLAHLAKCIDLARRQDHKTISLITDNAVSGGFLSFGMMADRVYALSDVSVRVMDLKAMSRVTKIDDERLAELAKSSPIFAPGAENFERMGGIESVWTEVTEHSATNAILSIHDSADLRMFNGANRGGRTQAHAVVQSILAA